MTDPTTVLPLAPVPSAPQRLVYLGTPEAAVPPLRALHAAGFDVLAVVTRDDKRRGRGADLVPSPVKQAAIELGIPVHHRVDDVLAAGADLGVVVAFGAIIRPHVLAELPMINVHFSLLPRWRGAAPVERAVLAGDTETGVCIMRVEHGLDTGDVYARCMLPISDRTTAHELRDALATAGAGLLVATIRGGLRGAQPQVGEPTYAAKLDRAEFAIDWRADAVCLDRLVRVGGAWTTWRGRRLRVMAAEPVATVDGGGHAPGTLGEDGIVMCGMGRLRLLQVQAEGQRSVPFSQFANGARLAAVESLGELAP